MAIEQGGSIRLNTESGGEPNKPMHATRDTAAVKILKRAGWRVMRGVRPHL